MSVRCGIIGVPNAGKSTLFNALTNANVATADFPFCTIEPNAGSIAVPDKRLEAIAEVVGVERKIPVLIDFVDIAGLVKGASQGEGLGNRFLSHIREMDVLLHVVGHYSHDCDEQSEIDVVNLELMLADLETVQKSLQKRTRLAQIGDKNEKKAVEILTQAQSTLEQFQPISSLSLEAEQWQILQQMQFLTAKPKFYVLNVSENQLEDKDCFELTSVDSAHMTTICAQLETELTQMPEQDQRVFRTEMGYSSSAVDNVVHKTYSLLNLSTFFTFNEDEVRGWAIRHGTTAREAAGRIHTDMEKGFIRAEVMSSEDLITLGSENAVKKAGKVRYEGKSYQPLEGEILKIRFNH